MSPLPRALIDFGHVLGAAIAIGGLLHAGFASLPAAAALHAERAVFLDALRRRARVLTWIGIALLLGTGLCKWLPALGGVGWLGGRGIHTACLHGKLVLALVVFALALQLTRRPRDAAAAAARPRRARLAAALAVAVALLAVLHRTRALG
jgi:uncharacterized membrane protein